MSEKILYETEEIANMYGVPPYTITQTWIKKGLKKIRGRRRGYLFKIEWVEEYLEEEAERNRKQKQSNRSTLRGKMGRCNVKVH